MPRASSKTPSRKDKVEKEATRSASKARGRAIRAPAAAPSPAPAAADESSWSHRRRRSASIANKSGLPEDILADHIRPPVKPHLDNHLVMPASIGVPPRWVTAWFLLSALICLWDAGYVLMRPLSEPDGKWGYLWKPYGLYGKIDKLYGPLAHSSPADIAWNTTQSLLNLSEIAATLLYLWFVREHAAFSNVIGIAISVMTAYKTIIYFMLEGLQGWQHTQHNDYQTFYLGYILPSSIWIIMPALVIFTLSLRIAWRL